MCKSVTSTRRTGLQHYYLCVCVSACSSLCVAYRRVCLVVALALRLLCLRRRQCRTGSADRNVGHWLAAPRVSSPALSTAANRVFIAHLLRAVCSSAPAGRSDRRRPAGRRPPCASCLASRIAPRPPGLVVDAEPSNNDEAECHRSQSVRRRTSKNMCISNTAGLLY